MNRSSYMAFVPALVIASFNLTFAQLGGGGGTSWPISIVPVCGLDEVTELHRDLAGNMISSRWTRDWLEGQWRLNGQLTSVGGLTLSPAPSMPAANDSSINAPIEMSSEGTQKLVVQYTGSPEEMPAEIGIVHSSTADSYYQSSGSADAANGLGNDSFYVIPGDDYNLVGLGGEYSTGKNLRIMCGQSRRFVGYLPEIHTDPRPRSHIKWEWILLVSYLEIIRWPAQWDLKPCSEPTRVDSDGLLP